MTQSASAETALGRLTDQVIASDLLLYAKAIVKAYASAITASTTPSVRILLKKQFDQAITYQEQVGAYVADRGWSNAGDLCDQLKMDAELTQNTLSLLK